MISFRKATFSDCELFNRWENDENVIQFLSISKGRTMEETIRELIMRENDPTVFDFMVLSDDMPIGRAYLSRFDEKKQQHRHHENLHRRSICSRQGSRTCNDGRTQSILLRGVGTLSCDT